MTLSTTSGDTKTLAIFGGSFNPPGIHHLRLAEQLATGFDEVVIVPCGPRPDKPQTDSIEPIFRATMVDMAFEGLPNSRVDLFDLEAAVFTRTWQLDERYRSQGEVWHVVGGDLVQGGRDGLSVIQKEWGKGTEIWKSCRFVVITRPGFPVEPKDLPPNHRLLEVEIPGSSSELRSSAFNNESIAGEVSERVDAYIQRHQLYRGTAVKRSTSLRLDEIRPLVVADPENPKAQQMAAAWPSPKPDDPNLIIVYGGDGSMLRAIRKHWRLRLPFYGINTGHLGFLLNPAKPEGELVCEHLPLLWTECLDCEGRSSQALAFNDAWVERATGQTAWIKVSIDGQVRLERLVADGALVATAAGSGSYARAMGASPMPLNTPALLLVGSNVLRPGNWRPAVLPLDAELEFETLDAEKRPLRGYIDGVDQGLVSVMRARISRIASVELAFLPSHNPLEKLARIQFPPLAK